MNRTSPIMIALLVTLSSATSFAKTVRYELTVRNEKVNLSGKKDVDFALTVNGGIPAPTLEFTEGDEAEILVKNEIPKEEVSIHWHGILLPPEEDGVPYINTPPIFPGTSRLFKFKVRQNGTFWYHSHTAVQEQKGVYGAFIIHPKKKAIQYDKDAVVVLSDWSDENADQILRNLRKDGDYYLYKKDSVRSYFGALQAGGLKAHLQNEWSRMGGMDLSDVGYDAFLINGKRDSQLLIAHPGEKVRVRIINAGASSYFYVSMGVPMQVISADGVDIEPVQAKEVLIGMAETYDILFTVPGHKNYELRATAQDVTGFASGWIGMGEKVKASDKPLPNLYMSMINMADGAMSGMHHGSDSPTSMPDMDHSKMSDSPKEMDHSTMEGMDHSKMEGMQPTSPATQKKADHSQHVTAKSISKTVEIDWSSQSDAQLQQNSSARDLDDSNKRTTLKTLSVDSLTAVMPTTLPKDANVHDLKMVLGGDMARYIWHINGRAIYEDRLIYINKGEIVRFTFQNETMMHHPMHLHGHFFRVLNESGDKSPLKHTVDVPPHGTRTIEFYANEPGQWMLHCHNLYHMKTGMARIVRYNDFKLPPEMEKNDQQDPHRLDHFYTYSSLEAGSNHAKGQFKLMRTWDEFDFQIESADVDGKNFEFKNPWETEGNAFYRRWFSNFFNVIGGADFYNERAYGLVGVGYILPLLIDSDVFVNHEGKFRFDLKKRFQWTKHFFSDADFTWRPNWGGERDSEFEVSLMYGPSWNWAAGIMFTEKSFGVGGQVLF